MARTGQRCERAHEAVKSSHGVVKTLYILLNPGRIKLSRNAPLFERPGTRK